ncbi:hypothetical protein CERSUDRAFT_101797 [Gelatoporia subvermispora B]|uniref:Uncharacterized protein n=1 Tax=Ceriporiopsis subvermispora (strain B) TaxID=914234 RepID=M2PWS4_CERS8|nr:hypothetical protein CERSUDRAFT_101797 [Gelatoporia subvermispora B]
MRGPNKAKRQGIAPERRSSVVSSDSGSDDIRGFESSDIPPAVIATAPSPPQRSAVAPTQLPPSPAGHSGISMMTAPSGSLSPRRRLRPPPIDLGSAGSLFSSVQPDFMKQPMYEAGLPDFYADRRASLPAYLLESYSRVALDNDDTALLSGRSTGSRESFVSDGSSPADGFSVSSLPRSESSGPCQVACTTAVKICSTRPWTCTPTSSRSTTACHQ